MASISKEGKFTVKLHGSVKTDPRAQAKTGIHLRMSMNFCIISLFFVTFNIYEECWRGL
jgi:hypothetical protein